MSQPRVQTKIFAANQLEKKIGGTKSNCNCSSSTYEPVLRLSASVATEQTQNDESNVLANLWITDRFASTWHTTKLPTAPTRNGYNSIHVNSMPSDISPTEKQWIPIISQ